MGFVPGYENDVFISYAHADNDPTIPGRPGWVDYFEELLRRRVAVRQRGEITFFRDQQLRIYGKFSDQLAHHLAKSAVLLCIPSPNYVESDWCLWELDTFCKQAGSGRIIKVAKTGFDGQALKHATQELLAQLQHTLEVRFYTKNESSDLFEDLQPEVISDHIPDTLKKVDVIAQNLVELFKKLRADTTAVPSLSANAPQTSSAIEVRPTVYLAETTKELEGIRNNIRSELLQFNYRVLPGEALSHDPKELIGKVRGYLQETKLAVHLVGNTYGAVPEDETRSIPHLQYDLAAVMSRESKLTQMIWFAPDLAPKDERQTAFVDDLKSHAHEYLQTILEDLKTEIRKRLEAPKEAGGPKDDEAPVNICLCYHKQDRDSVGPLFRHLTLHEFFSVKLLDESASNHRQALQSADGVLLYHGAATLEWALSQWRLIQRHTSVGRAGTALAKAIYAGPPPDEGKDMLLADSAAASAPFADEVLILVHYDKFAPDLLAPFIKRVKAAKGGTP